jgi:hypothetical protein
LLKLLNKSTRNYFQIAGRRNLKVITIYIWNGRNTGLMNLGDLINPSATATFWVSKDPSGNWT